MGASRRAGRALRQQAAAAHKQAVAAAAQRHTGTAAAPAAATITSSFSSSKNHTQRKAGGAGAQAAAAAPLATTTTSTVRASSSFLKQLTAFASAKLSATSSSPATRTAAPRTPEAEHRAGSANAEHRQPQHARSNASALGWKDVSRPPPPKKRPFENGRAGPSSSSVNPFSYLDLPAPKSKIEAKPPTAPAAPTAHVPSSEASAVSILEQIVTSQPQNDTQRQKGKQKDAAEGQEEATPQRERGRSARLWSSMANVEGAQQGKLSGLGAVPEPVEPLRKMKVATLAHGLDRVLFNPGVHWLRDPRTGIYNFSPSLRNILDPDLFDYDALPPYITSSADKELETIARRTQSRYCGSTSSLTALLSQCYFLISGRKPPNLTGFSEPFNHMGHGFSGGASLPASIKLMYKPGKDASDGSAVYAIDADKSASGELENSNYVLAALGKSMEKMLTVDDEEFRRFERVERWKRAARGEVDPPSEPEAYHYAKLSRFMMRSQLDCYDPRLPNKTFDLKTRAAVAIRQDRANWVESSGYQIRSNLGLLESFEREYFDMVRAAFLKYGFQARIGNMDGIFVAYHNTREIFGFQYVPLDEIFTRVFGTVEMGEQAFSLSVRLLEAILDSATKIYPKQSLRLTLAVSETKDPHMTVFAEPADASSNATKKAAGNTEATAQQTTSPSDPFGEPIDQAISSSSQSLSDRAIVQLDVKVDRFLNGTIVQGHPVDFASMPGRNVNLLKEDEIARRQRKSLEPLDWTIDYAIQPRRDLTEAEVNRHLSNIRSLQVSISSMTVPNLDAVAAREVELEAVLRAAGGEDAVERWKAERREGKIGRMPRAPGQALAEAVEEAAAEVDDENAVSESSAMTSERASAEGGAAAGTTTAASSETEAEASRDEDTKLAGSGELDSSVALPRAAVDLGEGVWAPESASLRRVRHLRALARLGAEDRIAFEKRDRRQQV